MASMGKNPRITVKERNLIRGALRRVFARSELRRAVIKATILEGYSDPERPRVKTWCFCKGCETPRAISEMVVDHMEPVVPLDTDTESQTFEEFIDRLWCNSENLQAICREPCHDTKTQEENKQRRARKKKLDNKKR